MNSILRHPLLPIAAIVTLTISTLAYRPAHVNSLANAVFDWMHIPVFGLIAVAVFSLLRGRYSRRRASVLAFAASVGLGATVELIQIPLGRTASVADLIADAAGALAFLLVANAMTMRWTNALLMWLAALGIAAYPSLNLVNTAAAYHERNQRFPVLFGGDGDGEQEFFDASNGRHEVAWDAELGRLYTRLSVPAGVPLRAEIRNIVADWGGFEELELVLGNPTSVAIRATVRVHDRNHRATGQRHNDRFNQNVVLPPGITPLRIRLREIVTAPAGRQMDIGRMEAVIVFTAASDAPQAVDVFSVGLR